MHVFTSYIIFTLKPIWITARIIHCTNLIVNEEKNSIIISLPKIDCVCGAALMRVTITITINKFMEKLSLPCILYCKNTMRSAPEARGCPSPYQTILWGKMNKFWHSVTKCKKIWPISFLHSGTKSQKMARMFFTTFRQNLNL